VVTFGTCVESHRSRSLYRVGVNIKADMGAGVSWNLSVQVYLTPEVEAELNGLATETGRATEELVQDAVAGYLGDLAEVRGMLDRRYDEIKSGKVKPIDGEAFFEGLREREDELPKSRLRASG